MSKVIYRHCIIEKVMSFGKFCVWEWYRPEYVDIDDDGNGVWCGSSTVGVADCKNAIDEYYEEMEDKNEKV